LYMILNTLHNFQTTEQQMTPNDNRRRKKSKQRIADAVFDINTTSTSNDLVTPSIENNIETTLPPTIEQDKNVDHEQTNLLNMENSTTENDNEQTSLNLTQMSENQLTPTRMDNLQETSTFSHDYNSEDMIQLSQLSPINTSRITQHLHNNTNNNFNTSSTSTTTHAIPIANDELNSIQPRNLINIFPNSRENSQSDINKSTKGNLETQEPGHPT
jgi:hypothetical protein